MKLIVEKGELNLPEDFSFEIEQNSAFFSEDGAASVAATIPATPADLAKLDNPTRIARSSRYVNLFPAILSHGSFQKKGTLVVESASKDGITCAMALEDSDFYSKYKDTKVRDIFGDAKISRNTGVSVCYNYLWNVYVHGGDYVSGNSTQHTDIRVFPVAVNYDSEDDSFQVNNEPQYQGNSGVWPLLHSERTVKEGDDNIAVPDGYGIAPFLTLSGFFKQLFYQCGYTVRNNCFGSAPLSNLVLLHQCSDVICKGRILYADLVPNKTVKEMLEWINNKFHAQIVVYPASDLVDIVLMEDILAAGYDKDLTGKLLGNLTTSFSKPSRVVLVPDTSLEGAAPATDTLQELKAKYGSVTELDEAGWDAYTGQGLLFRKATGMYYEVILSYTKNAGLVNGVSTRSHTTSSHSYGSSRSSSTSSGTTVRRSSARQIGMDSWEKVGSNYFTYDRKNSDETEEFTQEDLMPPMVFVNGMLMPYIGERKHRNTTYQESAVDEDQEIMICDFAGLSASCTQYSNVHTGADDATAYAGEHYYYGTTQKHDNAGETRTGGYDFTPEGMMPYLFERYNQILLNNKITLEGRFDLSIQDIIGWKMYSLKLMDGQKLLPAFLSYEVGKKIRCLNAKLLLVKEFADAVADEAITIPEPSYQWVLNDTDILAVKAAWQAQYSDKTIYLAYNDPEDTSQELFIPAPTAAGQTSAVLAYPVKVGYYTRNGPASNPTGWTWTDVGTDTVNIWFDSEAI